MLTGTPVLERQAAVAGDVIGVRMGLEHADDPHACLLGFFEVGLDRVGGVDDHRLAGRLVADQVGRAAEVVIHKLAEQHVSTTLPTSLASFLEVSSTRQRALVAAGAILVAGLVVGAVALTLLDSGHGSLVQAPTREAGCGCAASACGRARAGAGGRLACGRARCRAGSAASAHRDGARLERRPGLRAGALVPRRSRAAGGAVLRARLLRGVCASWRDQACPGGAARRRRHLPDTGGAAAGGGNRRAGRSSLPRPAQPRLRRVASLEPQAGPAHDLAPEGAERGHLRHPARSLGGDHRAHALGPRQPRRSLAALAADPGAERAAADLGRRRHERARARNGPRSTAGRSGSSPSRIRRRRPGSPPRSTGAPTGRCACA